MSNWLLTILCWSAVLWRLTAPAAHAAAIEGVLLTERGVLADGEVRAYASLVDTFAGTPVARSTAGAKPGFYRLDLPPGRYFLIGAGRRAGRPYFAYHGANPVTIGGEDLWLPISLTPVLQPAVQAGPGRVLTGVVTFRGKPVANAQVSLYAPTGGVVRGMGLATRTTAADGSFAFTPTAGDYLAVARLRRGPTADMQLHPGDLFCYFAGNPVSVGEGREVRIEIPCYPRSDLAAFLDRGVEVKRLREESARFRERRENRAAALTIRGTVTDLAGRPGSGLAVAAYRAEPGQLFQMHLIRTLPAAAATADAAGTYLLTVPAPGRYYLVARERGGEAPARGERFGLYEGNVDHAVTVAEQGAVAADIPVGRVMAGDDGPAATGGAVVANVTLADTVIDRDTTWSGKIAVAGRVLVGRRATLTIAPGTEVAFRRIDRDGDGIGDGELRVLGRLIARGTAQRPIRFVSAEARPRAGDWSYVLLFGSAADNVVERCRFEYAFTGLQVHFSRAEVRDSVFANNREGLRFGRAVLVVEHNDFLGNGCGIRQHRLEGPVVIPANRFLNNGVGIFLVPSGQNTVDFSPGEYEADPRYRMLPEIRNNNFIASRDYHCLLGDRLASDIPLGDNWWGTTDDTLVRSAIFDHDRDPALGRVVEQPLRPLPVPDAGVRKGD